MDRTALITGGSSGLGLEMARVLREKGYDLILLARDPAKLQTAKASLEASAGGGFVDVYSCDVSDTGQLTSVFSDVAQRGRRIDFLILNAGVATVDVLTDYRSVQAVVRNVEVNLLGVIATVYLCAPLLAQGCRVLFISSGFGLVGAAGYSLYASAKAGINNFADALRREWLRQGVAVHVACPGDIDTPMFEHELKTMPAWIREKMGRGKPKRADVVARYILDKCFKGRYMIVPSLDVAALILVQKLLPRALSIYLLDRILPLPPPTVGRVGNLPASTDGIEGSR